MEQRIKRERSEWLKLLDALPPCGWCGVIAGPCLCDIMEGLQNTEDHYVCDCMKNYEGIVNIEKEVVSE